MLKVIVVVLGLVALTSCADHGNNGNHGSKNRNVDSNFFNSLGKLPNGKQYYSGKGIKLNWLKAVEFCQKYNMVLAELPTEKDQTDFLNLISNQRDYPQEGQSNQVYLGATNAGWVWKSNGQGLTYTNVWDKKNFGNTGATCLTIKKKNGVASFTSKSCQEEADFICSKSD